MSSIYIDQHYGVSGDMINAALLNMEDNFEYLKKRLNLLGIDGYSLEYNIEKRSHIAGGRFIVHINEKYTTSRNFADIKSLISNSKLSDKEKSLSLKIFTRIAQAESIVHGINIEKIHFHEVGALDSIIDIVGFSILVSALKIKKFYASPFYIGSGKTISQHGEIPIPAPATVELLKGHPVCGTEQPYELTTPTGAAIVTSISDKFIPLPKSIIRKVGIGFGSRKNNFNALRIYLTDEYSDTASYNDETIVIIETTIDDSTPEEIAFLQELLLNNGALDAFITPVIMKKNRAGFNITLISTPQNLDNLIDVIFKNSSTFGIRYNYILRKTLERKIINVDSKYGTIPVKIGYYGYTPIKYSPEYDVCARISREKGIPIREIFENAIAITKKILEI